MMKKPKQLKNIELLLINMWWSSPPADRRKGKAAAAAAAAGADLRLHFPQPPSSRPQFAFGDGGGSRQLAQPRRNSLQQPSKRGSVAADSLQPYSCPRLTRRTRTTSCATTMADAPVSRNICATSEANWYGLVNAKMCG